jgi:hypothetical protein
VSHPYTASTGSDGKPYVEGPGDGLGYYSGTLWPGMRLSSKQDAEAAAKIANEAHRMGYAQAQADIRAALGIKG